ncbi:MAG: thermonuclease family protein [Proteobacteria bacterium]|nr:thermonuclease family protein [Pseudomonadota bacterium]NBP13803.1 thermonuclease family protein [bacterium]
METYLDLFKPYTIDTPAFTLPVTDTLARLVNIYDGDTMTVVFSVFEKYYKFSVRLAGIDTCELKSKDPTNKQLAIKARDRLFSLTTCTNTNTDSIKGYLNNNIVLVRLFIQGYDKYGRLLCKVTSPDCHMDFAEILLKENLAYKYTGEKKLSEMDQARLLDS